MPSLILFDFDDTLADTERHMARAFYPALMEQLKPYKADIELGELMVKNTELYRQHGSSLHGWMHELGLDMDFTLRMFKEMAPTIRGAVLPHMKPNVGLLRRLRELKEAGHTLAILTLGHRDYCLPIIERLGLKEFFPDDMVFDISVMEGRIKRNEDTYHYLLKHHLKGKYRHKFLFEDSMANLMAAHKAGFTTLLVGPNRPPEELGHTIDHQSPSVSLALDHLMTELLPA